MDLNSIKECASDTDYGGNHSDSSAAAINLALSIDHILEQIFSLLELEALTNCRAVSHRWKYFASVLLEKEMTIEFVDFNFDSASTLNSKSKSPPDPKQCSENPVQDQNQKGQSSSKELKTLSDLGNVFNDCDRLSFQFPCKKFTFSRSCNGETWGNLSDSGFQNFLFTYGHLMSELHLNFPDHHNQYGYSYWYNVQVPNETAVMTQIQNLLLNQTANLKMLTLNIASNISWKNEEDDERSWMGSTVIALKASDEEFIEICENATKYKLNTKLKVLKVAGELSAKVLETAIQLSSNLEEVIFEDECCLLYLLEPVNRLYLLKQLHFNLSRVNLDLFEKLAIAADSDQGNLQLRHLSISFVEFIASFTNLYSDYEIRVIHLLNSYLKSSARSLASITWHGIVLLGSGKLKIEWPPEFPNLVKLELGPLRGFQVSQISSKCLFPRNFNFSKTFPKLKSVTLVTHAWSPTSVIDFRNLEGFLNYLYYDFGPILSVKNVDFLNISKVGGPAPFRGSEEVLKLVELLFPNANFAKR